MPGDVSYRVVWSRRAMNALRELGRKRRKFGTGKLAQVVRDLDQKLRREPLEVGEVYRSRGAVAAHLAIYEFLAIDFAIDKQRKLVLVRDCRASGHGL